MRNEANCPLVSIIIPTYNYAGYLPKAIESCLNQSHKSLEIIVVDDGSTDNTERIVQGYGDKVAYVFQNNGGVSSARNKGLEAATGEFIAFLDADDYLMEDAIEVRLDILLKHPDVGAVITETYSKKGGRESYRPKLDNDMISSRFHEHLLLGRFPFATCAALIRSDIAKRFRFPVDLSNGEDIVYFAKVFFSTKVQYLQKPTAVTVWHEDSLRHNIGELKKQGIGLVPAILDDPLYNGTLNYLRKDFTSNRYLELFRKVYLFDDKKLAKQYYKMAISVKPLNIFKIDYLIKFIKASL